LQRALPPLVATAHAARRLVVRLAVRRRHGDLLVLLLATARHGQGAVHELLPVEAVVLPHQLRVHVLPAHVLHLVALRAHVLCEQVRPAEHARVPVAQRLIAHYELHRLCY